MSAENFIDLKALGFLGERPGREFSVGGHDYANTSGLLMLQVSTIRALSDPVLEAANRQGLALTPSYDRAHPDFVLLETIGPLQLVELMARDLAEAGYHRLEPINAGAGAGSDGAPPHVDFDTLPDPMTDEDIARVFRYRSVSAVQRMRLEDGLPFTPGRPPTVTKKDLMEYIERSKVTLGAHPVRVNDAPPAPEPEMTARQRAIKMKLRAPRRPRGKGA